MVDSTEEEQQVVVPGEHVGRAEAHVLQRTALEHRLLVGRRHSVREAGRARQEGKQRNQWSHAPASTPNRGPSPIEEPAHTHSEVGSGLILRAAV